MGLLSFRRDRKAPSPLFPFSLFPVRSTENNSDFFPAQPRNSKLLDRFSQEVGTVTSASGWAVPEIIHGCVDEYLYTSSTSHSPRSNKPLHLRGGNMDDFDVCDPNSPTALETCPYWIDQDYYDEQCALRQDPQGTQQHIQQISPHVEPLFNPPTSQRSSQQGLLQQNTNTRLYPQVFRPLPSVDDTDDDEEADEFTNNGHVCLLTSPFSFTDSSGGSSIRSGSEEYYEQTTVCPQCGRDNSYIMDCYSPDTPDLAINTRPSVSPYSEHSYQGSAIYGWDSDSQDDEQVEDDWAHVQNRSSEDSYVIGCYAPDSIIATGLDSSEYDADSEASESMWNFNRSTLQGSDLPDYEEIENWDYTCNPNSLDSSITQVAESDFWSISMELHHLLSSVLGFSYVSVSPATVNSVCDEDALPEPNEVLAEQNLFSPTSVYNDNAYA
jgi:hypothetical protein